MAKTGKGQSLILLILMGLNMLGFIAGVAPNAQAQDDVDVKATVSETKIYSGERISLSVEVSGQNYNNVSRPNLPDIPGFRLVSNTPSTSRSYSFVNGKSSTSFTYTYYLIAEKSGSYTIPPVEITVDKKSYTTKPIQVQILDRNQSSRKQGGNKPDIFLQMEVTNKRPYNGQQIIANLILYFRDNIEVNSYQPIPGWKAEGFWKEELDDNKRPSATSTIIDGVRYRKARLLQYALFPTKQGELTLSPFQVAVSVRTVDRRRDDPFSSFFGGFGSNLRNIQLQTDPVTINVKPLPDIQDAQYIGAVGSFDIDRIITSKRYQAGETIELKTRIKGTGNIPLVSKPDYQLPSAFEIYKPQEQSDINRAQHQIRGSKTFSDVMVARQPGTYTIPEAKLAFFNPSTRQYVTRTLPSIEITVTPSNNAVTVAQSNSNLPVRPISGLVAWNTVVSTSILSHWWFWILALLPLVTLIAGYWQKRYRDRMLSDTAFARSEKAMGKAKERLQNARELAEDDIKSAYGALQLAITGYVADKLNLPEAGQSDEQYLGELKQKGVNESLIKPLRQLLNKCATIRYAPQTTEQDLIQDVEKAESIIKQLRSSL